MPEKILTRVTVTGADDSVTIEQLADIHRQYPWVEFGIQIGHSGSANRFPSKGWLSALQARKEYLPLSAHVCGLWVRRLLEFGEVPPFDFRPYRRIQIKTYGLRQPVQLTLLLRALTGPELRGKAISFQIDGANDDLAERVCVGLSRLTHERTAPIQALFDLSDGAGECPAEWPKPLEGCIECGYAGGLSPENLTEQLGRIAQRTERTWVDALTHLRSHNDAQFDLSKVSAFLEASRPWQCGHVDSKSF